MSRNVAAIPVLLAGIYLVGLALVAFAAPTSAKRFLGRFASTPTAHYTEILARLTVGVALLLYAQHMLFSSVVSAVGWVLTATTAIMLLLPWTWHHRFAAWSVPLATARIGWLGTGALVGGLALLYAVIAGPRTF